MFRVHRRRPRRAVGGLRAARAGVASLLVVRSASLGSLALLLRILTAAAGPLRLVDAAVHEAVEVRCGRETAPLGRPSRKVLTRGKKERKKKNF